MNRNTSGKAGRSKAAGRAPSKIKKRKPEDRFLEDRVWCLLYSLGYPVLNGAGFWISYSRADCTTGRKQIDVFAKDAETAIVVECKYKETRGKRSLQKDIHETENLKKPFANAIRKHFGASRCLKGRDGEHSCFPPYGTHGTRSGREITRTKIAPARLRLYLKSLKPPSKAWLGRLILRMRSVGRSAR